MNPIVVGSLVIASSLAYCSLLISNKIRERERKKRHDEFIFSLEDEYFLKNRQSKLDKVKAAELAYLRDPLDSQTLKNWASALTHLAFMLPREPDSSKRAQWMRDAKSKLEQALEMDDKDYETMLELGKAIYSILYLDDTLKTRSKTYINLCHDAIKYLKLVQEKAPHLDYKYWLEQSQDLLPKGPYTMIDSEDDELDGEQEGEESEDDTDGEVEENEYFAMIKARLAQQRSLEKPYSMGDDDKVVGGEQKGEYD